jgi:hypothetical protein
VVPGYLSLLTAREHTRDLQAAADRHRHVHTNETPVTRLTLRYGSAADAERLRRLAQLDSARVPSGPVLVAEVDGLLRAALPLDGTGALADPFHHGADLLELLRLRAAQLGLRSC